MNWDEYFINIAQQVNLKSIDNNTQIGVVIVGKDNEIVSTGYNSFPRGIDDSVEERQDKPEKYFWFEHAERNAIYNAARIGVSTLGTTMYMTCDISCADCARGIINAGIKTVVFTKSTKPWNQIWKDSAERSIKMFEEAKINVKYFEK